MKKINLIGVVLLLSSAVVAQSDTANFETAIIKTDRVIKQQPKDAVCANCAMMKDGKMMIMMYGKLTQMESDITLLNGTKIMIDGVIITKDGTKSILKEGDYLDISEN